MEPAQPDPDGDRYLLREASRPQQPLPIEEDEHGTYVLNSKDLRAVEHVAALVRMGVDSLKIEGRTKSHYYVARTAQVYRRAIDDALANRPLDPELLGLLENLANRGYTDGFYKRHHSAAEVNFIEGASGSRRQRFVAEIVAADPGDGLVEVLVKNRFSVGDSLELITPGGNTEFTLAGMLSNGGEAMQTAPGGGYQVRIPLPVPVAGLGLIARNLA